MTLSNEQKALVHVAKSKLQLEEDVYREILFQEAGVRSAKDLSPAGLDRVMKRFHKLGFRKRSTAPKPPRAKAQPNALITKGMLDKIQHLYEDIGWDSRTRQMGFNMKMIGHPWPQTRADGNKIIEALKAMRARRKAGD